MNQPISVLIADDEMVQREMLKRTIPWEEHGFRICGEARNGPQALELCRQLQPDIALIDINMPGLSGLEVIRRLREEKNPVRAIIVSGHDEFEYAREAIKLSVEEYVLKPVDEDELLAIAERLKNRIQARQKYSEYVCGICRQMEEDQQRLCTEFLRRCLHSETPDSELSRAVTKFSLPAQAQLLVLCVELEELSEQVWNSSDLAVCRFGIRNILAETLAGQQAYILEEGLRTVYAIVFFSGKAADQSAILALCQSACETIERHMHLRISAGLSDSVAGLSDAVKACRHAVYAQKQASLLHCGCVIAYDSLRDGYAPPGLSAMQREELKQALRAGDRELAKRRIETLLHDAAGADGQLRYLQNLTFSLLSVCAEFADEYHVDGRFLLFSYRELSDIFDRFRTWQDIAAWLTGLACRCADSVDEHTRIALHVERAKEYVQKHYSNCNLRVGDIARYLYLNENYLSAEFAKKSGMSIVEYITAIRLSQAKALMDAGELNIGKVAEKVGYLDANYFSKCFKKRYGMSPRRYLSLCR